MAVELRHLRPGEEKQLGKTMSAAIFNDPLLEYMVPDEETRMAKGQWFFEKAAAYCARWGEV